MDNAAMYTLDVTYGSADIRSWFERDVSADGSVRYVGKSCLTTRDRFGAVVAVDFGDTGATLTMA